MDKGKGARRYITLAVAFVSALVLINASYRLIQTASVFQEGFYQSNRFAMGLGEVLSLVGDIINESDLVYNKETKSYELSEEYQIDNAEAMDARIDEFVRFKEDRLKSISDSGYIESLGARAKKENEKEIEQIKEDIKNAEEIVTKGIVENKRKELSVSQEKLRDRKYLSLRIIKGNEVIYKQGDEKELEEVIKLKGRDVETSGTGESSAESEGEMNVGEFVSGNVYHLMITDALDNQDALVAVDDKGIIFPIDFDDEWNLKYEKINEFGERVRVAKYEVLLAVKGEPNHFAASDRFGALYSMFQKDLAKRALYYGVRMAIALAVLYYMFIVERKKQKLQRKGIGMENQTLGKVNEMIQDKNIEKIFDKIMFYISKLKLEPKVFLFFMAWNALDDFTRWRRIIDDVGGTIRSLILIGIGIIIFVDFLKSDKDSYIRNSYWHEWKESRRKKRFAGLAKGTEYIFDSIALVGTVIVLCFIIGVVTYGEFDLYMFASLFGGLYILIMVSRLRAKLMNERVAYIDEISDCVQKMMDGDMLINIPERDQPFGELARNINKMKMGYGTAVEQQVKSERMKSELITNVSHDLKTPLTSIINYIDLLKKENIEPEYAQDYVKVLEQKSQKLNMLIQDLFEVSRAASGDVSLHLERLDVGQLLQQTLAEMDGKIKDSGLDFVVNIPSDPIYVIADGKKLHRIFDNLIINALKYSLKGTRVYIDFVHNGYVKLSMKNISNYEMNFHQDEIVQRFIRADKARSSEGSGLGLAIAKSFVDLMNMDMKIITDGDLFKVEITMEIAR